mmetsp:Transcript_18280/g.16570  ORF Transcript_18280/g.16570 Transcript_18280/m.16570 type:complete len:171 (-) Transcript_18280:39-551(-)
MIVIFLVLLVLNALLSTIAQDLPLEQQQQIIQRLYEALSLKCRTEAEEISRTQVDTMSNECKQEIQTILHSFGLQSQQNVDNNIPIDETIDPFINEKKPNRRNSNKNNNNTNNSFISPIVAIIGFVIVFFGSIAGYIFYYITKYPNALVEKKPKKLSKKKEEKLKAKGKL